jgi:hypothetical protein
MLAERLQPRADPEAREDHLHGKEGVDVQI